MSRYQRPTSTRTESRTLTGRFRGGKLTPVMAAVVRESESAILSQSCVYELDPIAGRIITPITAELISVFVPVQAIDALKNPEEAYAGNTEVVRDKLLSGTPLFGLEAESEISKRCGVNPRSIGGQKRVNEVTRLAHNAAVNHLRVRKYRDATQILADNMDVTPALITETVLQRLNAVLDPEDRVDGMVSLELGTMQLPVQSVNYAALGSTTKSYLPATQEGAGNLPPSVDGYRDFSGSIHALFDGAKAGGVSLTDFYNAQLMDELTRMMSQLLEDNPEYGDEIVSRWAHGLSMDTGKTPFVIHERTADIGKNYRRAMDGPSLDQAQTDLIGEIGFTVPVPASELGGIVITFATIKPDEALADQPHPFLSEEWGATNYVSEEMARDPEPVNMRELNSDVAQGSEGTRAFYVGHNHMKKSYVNYGFTRQTDRTKVDNKTSIWQLEIPMSVTPDNILYPADLDHYPFADQTAEVCTYTISSVQTTRTPMIFGPTPVEEMAVIEDDDIFEDAPEP